jgi:hypothetical protein
VNIAAHRRRAIRWLAPLVTLFVVSLIAIEIEKVAVPRLDPGAASFLAGFVGAISALPSLSVLVETLGHRVV